MKRSLRLFFTAAVLAALINSINCVDSENKSDTPPPRMDPCNDYCSDMCIGNKYVLFAGYTTEIDDSGRPYKISGYNNFRLTPNNFDTEENYDLYLTDNNGYLKPEIFDGLIATAVEGGFDYIKFRVDSLGIDIYGFRNNFDFVPNIVAVSQLECAQHKWLNKFIHVTPEYFTESLPPTKRILLYNDRKEKRAITLVDSLQVISISPDKWHSGPIKLRVRTTDGFISDYNAWANQAHSHYKDRFTDQGNTANDWQRGHTITLSDDLHSHIWPDSVWAAIGQGRIVKGMPKDALLLNWGNPNDSLFSRIVDSPYLYVYWGGMNNWDCHVYIQNDSIKRYEVVYKK